MLTYASWEAKSSHVRVNLSLSVTVRTAAEDVDQFGHHDESIVFAITVDGCWVEHKRFSEAVITGNEYTGLWLI
jgi:hypothetical protein